MNRNLAILSMLVGLFCSCSRGADEPDFISPDVITFADPAVDYGREGKDPTTTQNITQFSVSAYYMGDYNNLVTLMDNVTVNRVGPNKWTYSPAVAWPAVPLTFVAVSPASVRVSTNHHWEHTIQNYQCDGTTDLLEATKVDALQGEGNIKINFRHALSQVLFSICNGDPDVEVRVHKIYIKDVATSGDFFYPKVTTSPLDFHEVNANAEANAAEDAEAGMPENTGYWRVYNLSATKYTLYEAQKNPATGEYEDLDLGAAPMTVNSHGSRYFLPCRLNPLKFTGYYHGSRIEVVYKAYDRASGKQIWPTTSTGYADLSEEEPAYAAARYDLTTSLPDSTWHPGSSYRYATPLRIP